MFNGEELGSQATEKRMSEFWLTFCYGTLESPSFHIYEIQVVIVPGSSKIVMNKKRKKAQVPETVYSS